MSNYILPGDLILANQGFSIQQSASLYCAEVKVPVFTKGKVNVMLIIRGALHGSVFTLNA